MTSQQRFLFFIDLTYDIMSHVMETFVGEKWNFLSRIKQNRTIFFPFLLFLSRWKQAEQLSPERPALKLSRSKMNPAFTVIELRLTYWRTCTMRSVWEINVLSSKSHSEKIFQTVFIVL